ncbi:MAG: hypothetical protein IKE25_14035 [Clostridia bacterium]|nr:hypothetical protein [Clostridia bacterium]
MGEIIKMTRDIGAAGPSMEAVMGQIADLLQSMAEMVRATNERMTALERQVRLMEKVTPAQTGDLNQAIRDRASAVCQEYRMPGAEKPVTAAIRKSVRLTTGAQCAREIARCDYKPVRAMIDSWDEFTTIRRIREARKNDRDQT